MEPAILTGFGQAALEIGKAVGIAVAADFVANGVRSLFNRRDRAPKEQPVI